MQTSKKTELFPLNSRKTSTAIIHDFLIYKGGAETNLLNFLKTYPNADLYFLFIIKNPNSEKFLKEIQTQFPKVNIKTSVLQNIPFLSKLYKVYKFLTVFIIELLPLQKYDLIIFQTAFLSKGWINLPHQKSILYINTPFRWLWHLPTARQKLFNFIPNILVYTFQTVLRYFDWHSTRKASIILANSNAIKQKIKKYYQLESTVLWPAIDCKKLDKISQDLNLINKVDSNFFTKNLLEKLKLPTTEYIVILNRLEKFKQNDVAIRAFLKDKYLQTKTLLIIGDGEEYKHLVNYALNMSKSSKILDSPEFLNFDNFKTSKVDKNVNITQIKNIIFLQNVSDDLKWILASNSLCLLNINEEDFGLNMAEFSALGKPIIAYKKGGALDIIKQKQNGLFFEKQTAKSISKCVKNLKKLINKDIINEQTCKDVSQKFDIIQFESKLKSLVGKQK